MNRLSVFTLALGIATASVGQARPPELSKAGARIVALEQAGWTAWKNRDPQWYRENTAAEVVWINSDGITDKAQFLEDLPTDCRVEAFDLADYRVTTETPDLVVLTYTAAQDGICAGKKLPERIRAAVVYVQRNGKWIETLYMETPLAKK